MYFNNEASIGQKIASLDSNDTLTNISSSFYSQANSLININDSLFFSALASPKTGQNYDLFKYFEP